MDKEHTKEIAGFVCQEVVDIKDKETGQNTRLYKTYFLTSDKKLLTYWLTFPVQIESQLPPCEIHMEKRVSREGKFELKIVDVKVV